jgi:hypothetical protein
MTEISDISARSKSRCQMPPAFRVATLLVGLIFGRVVRGVTLPCGTLFRMMAIPSDGGELADHMTA